MQFKRVIFQIQPFTLEYPINYRYVTISWVGVLLARGKHNFIIQYYTEDDWIRNRPVYYFQKLFKSLITSQFKQKNLYLTNVCTIQIYGFRTKFVPSPIPYQILVSQITIDFFPFMVILKIPANYLII